MPRLILKLCLIILSTAMLTSCGSDSETDHTGKCSALGLTEPANTAKIVNGTICSGISKSPVVLILKNTPDGRTGACSGTMLSPNKVLTAAHCLEGAASIEILYGTANDKFASVKASSWNIHPAYSRDSFTNDVGIVHSPASLPVPNLPILTSTAPKNEDRVSIFGFGVTSGGGSVDGKLRVGAMNIGGIDTDKIYAYFDGGSSNTCSGDSGGPMLLQVGGQQAIIGTTSYGSTTNCAVGELSAFMNLQSPVIKNFIMNVAPDARYQ
jgi:secreted trypsin-like serine protease